jgi:hypothetical protein
VQGNIQMVVAALSEPSSLLSSASAAFFLALWFVKEVLVQGKVHFSELMTGMLHLDNAANSTKLVGPIINCQGIVHLAAGVQRDNPHLQLPIATDQTGERS